jgi:hypothetical protein
MVSNFLKTFKYGFVKDFHDCSEDAIRNEYFACLVSRDKNKPTSDASLSTSVYAVCATTCEAVRFIYCETVKMSSRLDPGLEALPKRGLTEIKKKRGLTL